MSFQMRKINNLRWTDDRIAIIKQYLKDKTLPNTISSSAKRRIINQFNNNTIMIFNLLETRFFIYLIL